MDDSVVEYHSRVAQLMCLLLSCPRWLVRGSGIVANTGLFHGRAFLVLASGSRAEWLCVAVTEALAIVRFPGELVVSLRRTLGLGHDLCLPSLPVREFV